MTSTEGVVGTDAASGLEFLVAEPTETFGDWECWSTAPGAEPGGIACDGSGTAEAGERIELARFVYRHSGQFPGDCSDLSFPEPGSQFLDDVWNLTTACSNRSK